MNSISNNLPTPSVVVDIDRLEANIARMQDICTRHNTELWPHIKTHKMIEVGRRQIEAGAAGLSCAKLSEAEAMLPTGVRQIFVAHSLVGKEKAPRLQKLAEQLDTLLVACTSERHFDALEELLATADLRLPVMIAVDTGLGREGTRSADSARRLAKRVSGSSHMELRGFYTHEGHGYQETPDSLDAFVSDLHARLTELRDSVDPKLHIWPGSTPTAARMACKPGVQAVRPGAYVFGDLSQAKRVHTLEWDQVALHVRATVVDLPTDDLALIDAGSKVFSSDKSDGITALARDGRDIQVVRCNEEHGYLNGSDLKDLKIGDTLDFVPAHVCTVVNLTDYVHVARDGNVIDRWKVDARGCVT